MGPTLAAVGFVVLFVVGIAAIVAVLHRGLRATEMNARSATALRELEPRGGRHRFHVRLFEVIALSSAFTSGLGVLWLFAGSASHDVSLPFVGGGAMLVALWWAWRRGSLRAVEAEAARESPHA